MPHMDVFNSDAFSMGSLTAAINRQEFQPSFIRSLGIFTPTPIRTEFATIEERDGSLSLIQTSPRGAPVDQQDTASGKRKLHRLDVPRIHKRGRLTAGEVQGIRASGSESEMMQVQQEVARRMNGPDGLMRDVELTWENQALGAVQGKVLDADGSTIVDWFNVFGVSQDAEHAFDIANTAEGDLRPKATKVVRQMTRNAKGGMTPQTEIMALCGDNFYDDLTSHPEVRETFKNVSADQSERLRNQVGAAFDAIRWAGITWVNYRGTDDNNTVAVATDRAKFFPINSPGTFRVVYSPGEWFSVVNTPGQPVYALTEMEQRSNPRHVDLEVYSYPLWICTRPKMLQRAKRGA